jgi:hypothetical protein
MRAVIRAGAWRNGDLACLACDLAQPLPDYLDFMVARVHETGPDAAARLEQNLRDKLAGGAIPSFADAQDSGRPSGLVRLDSSWQDAHSPRIGRVRASDHFLDRMP